MLILFSLLSSFQSKIILFQFLTIPSADGLQRNIKRVNAEPATLVVQMNENFRSEDSSSRTVENAEARAGDNEAIP